MLAVSVINLIIAITTAVNSYVVRAPPWQSTDTVALEYCRSPPHLSMWGVAQMPILLEKLLNDLAVQCCLETLGL